MMPSLRFLAVLIASISLTSCAGASATADLPVPPAPAVDQPLGKPGEVRTAVLAGGCFWCIEGVFEQITGVQKAVAGYAGGTAETADYDHYAESGHAEAVQITYDASQVTYGQLLRVLVASGDPTSRDGQRPDFGHQYRMAIFATDGDQRRVADAYVRQLADSQLYARPIVVSVEPLPHGFFPAEDEHQRFVVRHPDHPYVCAWSKPKMERIRAVLPGLVHAPAAPTATGGPSDR